MHQARAFTFEPWIANKLVFSRKLECTSSFMCQNSHVQLDVWLLWDVQLLDAYMSYILRIVCTCVWSIHISLGWCIQFLFCATDASSNCYCLVSIEQMFVNHHFVVFSWTLMLRVLCIWHMCQMFIWSGRYSLWVTNTGYTRDQLGLLCRLCTCSTFYSFAELIAYREPGVWASLLPCCCFWTLWQICHLQWTLRS